MRALKVALTVVGLFFTAALYPVVMILWNRDHDSYGDAMGLSLYVVLGIMLLIAVRDPAQHRSLIAFAVWSSFAHAAVMATMVIRDERSRGEWLPTLILTIIGATLLTLSRRRSSATAGNLALSSGPL